MTDLHPDKLTGTHSERVLSIDAVRGFDMFWITGGGYFFENLLGWINSPRLEPLQRQLEHCEWDGFRFWDLIFPLFLFIVGTSMPFAMASRRTKGATNGTLLKHIIRRALTLFFLALIYNGLLDFDFTDYRYTGVLHRISVCYLVVGIIALWASIRTQAILVGVILLGYWALLMLVPVPGIGAGVLTPEGNLVGYIDRLLLPGKFCCYGYGDNEGILSTLPALATTLLGVLTGHWLRTTRSGVQKTLGMLAAGLVGIVCGSLWGMVFPVNKLIWTSSYVLVAGGGSLWVLAGFYYLIDVAGYRRWAFPFVVIGMNAITIYLAQGLFDFKEIADIFIHGFVDLLGGFKPVFIAGAVLLTQWLFLYFLYCKRIFLKA